MKYRRNSHDDHVNHERWLVSYADFITLMFAFFVVMYAVSNGSKGKVAELSEAVSRALAQGSGVRAHKGASRQATPVDLASSLTHLSRELDDEIRKGKVQIDLTSRGLVISLKEAAFFPTGDATIAAEAYPIFAKLAETIRPLPNSVRLEGHTDAIPIHNDRFRSNWHLSAARSIATLELFNQRFNVRAERLAAVGFADTVPVDTNDTPEGRAKNRRVDVTILNEAAMKQEPRQKVR
jgi:chemotaxis protein MotB